MSLPIPTQLELVKKYRVPIRGKLGQHLLIDPNLQRKIVNFLAPGPGETLLEIGPGLGALTGQILKRGASVIAVEKDERFVRILADLFNGLDEGRLTLIHQDILRWQAAEWFESRRDAFPGQLRVISNLPYYATTPILFWLIGLRNFFPEAVLMMQKEVADRILAEPGTKAYGRLSVMVRFYADVFRLTDISARCFLPPPEVDSSLVRLVFIPAGLRELPVEEGFFSEFVRVAFSQRRKTLMTVLTRQEKIKKRKGELLEIFQKNQIPASARSEELLLKDFICLARDLQPAGLI